jgi:hypothetical protein
VVKGDLLAAVLASKIPENPTQSIEIEQVLEHISSPYRWELLEVPPVEPKASIPGKPGQK